MLIVEYSPSVGNAIVYDKSKIWLIDFFNPEILTSLYGTRSYNVDGDNEFIRDTEFNDVYPYRKVRTKLKYLYNRRVALVYIKVSINEKNSIETRKKFAGLLIHPSLNRPNIVAYIKEHIEKILSNGDSTKLDESIIESLPNAYAKMIRKIIKT